MMKRFFILVMVLSLVSGCTHAVSRGVLKQVDRKITFAELLKAPNAYQGKVVLLGGIIVNTINKQEGTLLEVYETALDREGKPLNTDKSEGRFLALYQGYLDSEIYKQGRKVTIAGAVQGEKVQLLGEIQYHYPYLIVKEIRLWKEEELAYYDQYGPYPWGPWYDPWYPWGPWGWYPWGYPRYYHHGRHGHHGHH
ncbi:MAG TPA: Slp family lipoprotein [Thermodesulfobacteriota bacterium]|jgi:outer membrane lipoprotein